MAALEYPWHPIVVSACLEFRVQLDMIIEKKKRRHIFTGDIILSDYTINP
jgi:hypothetical protein